MNGDTINNDIITIDRTSSEQNPHVDNQQGENSTQNHIQSKEIINGNNKIKKTPMTPTRLYVSFISFSLIIEIFD
jgi:hypothetical protein